MIALKKIVCEDIMSKIMVRSKTTRVNINYFNSYVAKFQVRRHMTRNAAIQEYQSNM